MTANKVIVHTDGACSGNPGPGGWGAILDYNGTRKELSGGEADTTNNRMELMGAISALEALKRPCEVEMHVDSSYVKDGITKWIHGWKKNGWKTADKKPVKNAELWQRLDAALGSPQGVMALGEGPRRPRRQRTRRRAGARGHGAVQEKVGLFVLSRTARARGPNEVGGGQGHGLEQPSLSIPSSPRCFATGPFFAG